MAVIDGVFVPRSPLTAAESHVDFPAHNEHLLDARQRVERAALPVAERIPFLIFTFLPAPPTQTAASQLARVLARELERTARFGYAQAQAEVERARAHAAVTAAHVLPDAGRYGEIARLGLEQVLAFVARRALLTALAVTDRIVQALTVEPDHTRALYAGRDIARRSLHNHVLELVGETLNLGRTAGALDMATPPEFALRSEQLDANTCIPCDGLHGTITRVGSPEYFAILPPSGCLGGGRCRAIMVFSDGPRDVRQPERLAA